MHKPEERRGLCLSERLWQYVDVRDFNECWEWTGARDKRTGYGKFTIYPPDVDKKQTIQSHRLVYEQFWRTPLENWGLHNCNNPPCCNPFHVYDGTPSQNQFDSIKAGTAVVLREGWRSTARGEGSGMAKLTDEAVREIRRRYATGRITQEELGAEFGVNQTKISDVVNRRTWKHID